MYSIKFTLRGNLVSRKGIDRGSFTIHMDWFANIWPSCHVIMWRNPLGLKWDLMNMRWCLTHIQILRNQNGLSIGFVDKNYSDELDWMKIYSSLKNRAINEFLSQVAHSFFMNRVLLINLGIFFPPWKKIKGGFLTCSSIRESDSKHHRQVRWAISVIVVYRVLEPGFTFPTIEIE